MGASSMLTLSLIVAFLLCVGYRAAAYELRHREAQRRADEAVETICRELVLTPQQHLKLTKVFATPGDCVCIEGVSEDSRPENIRWFSGYYNGEQLEWWHFSLRDTRYSVRDTDYTLQYLK